MKWFPKVLFITLGILISPVAMGIPFKNQIFKESVHTIRLTDEATQSTFPIHYLNSSSQLTLRFDDIADEVKDYSYTLIHCDSKWNQSDLFPNDYLDGFEEEAISTYDYSVNTTHNYIHYSISFPNNNIVLTKSGNYILLVFEDFDRNKVVLTKKFYVAQSLVKIQQQPSTPVDFDHRYTHHEIDFNVDYSLTNVTDPFNEIKVVLLQNNRFDNAIYDLKPQFVRDKELIYNYEKENLFEAGNEYRVFDTRDISNRGKGVEETVYMDSIYHTILFQDEKRAFKKYSTEFDHNGNYYPAVNLNRSPYTEAEYTQVHFRLPVKKELQGGSVYINGELSNNEIEIGSRMMYRDSLQRYEATLLLKQGVYDYSYVFRPGGEGPANWESLEGSHYQTENLYTILIYLQGFNDNAEQLIGVKRFVYQ